MDKIYIFQRKVVILFLQREIWFLDLEFAVCNMFKNGLKESNLVLGLADRRGQNGSTWTRKFDIAASTLRKGKGRESATLRYKYSI